MTQHIKISGRRIWMHKGIVHPDFTSEHVLSRDPWQYVQLWFQRDKAAECLSYWNQAKRLGEASKSMPIEAAPLALYYSFLNATKALLTFHKCSFGTHHGVAGERPEEARTTLSNEKVAFKGGGVLPDLCQYLGETAGGHEYSLSDILWNIPFIHRAYKLTFPSKAELFIPLEKARYVRNSNSREAWFEAEVVPRFSDKRKLTSIPTSFETFNRNGSTIVRRKKNFNWFIGRSSKSNLTDAQKRLTTYHSTTRRVVVNISGQRDLWYLKRLNPSNSVAERHTLILMFAAMHRLSELARYDPAGLERHMAGKANWLLSEFILGSLEQFIDQVATEITGCQFWPPKVRS